MLSQQWNSLKDIHETTSQVESLQKKFQDKVEEIFPEKTVKLTSKDKPYMTKELKAINRRKKKEWKIRKVY